MWVIASTALVVAAIYAWIAVVVVPRLVRVAGSPRRAVTVARWGATAFFAGCGVTHLGLAVQALMDRGMAMSTPAVLAEHVLPHALQLIGGIVFIGVARRSLELTVLPKDEAERLAEQSVQFQVAFEEVPVGLALSWVSGPHADRLIRVNPALCTMLGFGDPSELVGRSYADLVDPVDAAAGLASRDALLDGQPWVELEQRLLHRQGHPVWTATRGSLVLAADGTPRFVIAQIRDITEDRRREAELRFLADHDPLTEVFNRRRFGEELDRVDAHARRNAEPAALLMVDLDHFRYVNDTHGHAAGDQVLAAVAETLRRRLRPGDVLGRLGGDEFGVLCPHVGPEQARAVATDLLAAIHAEVCVQAGDRAIRAAASIGITVLGSGAQTTGEQLMADADMAMTHAKETGRDRVTVSDDSTTAAAVRSRLAWAERIRDALTHDGFRLWEQPIRNLATGECDRTEILLRMVDPADGSLIAPGEFLPAAERFGQIQAIDRWVFRHAVALLAIRREAGDTRAVEVNLSGASLTDEDLVAELTTLIAQAPIDPERLIVEITETAAVRNFDLARSLAFRLRDLGCRFVLDDFGSGFGSFTYLKNLPVDGIKIDGEFVKDLPRSLPDRLTIEAIATLGHGLGKELTAEFVQDEETVALLGELGIGYAQGYYIGRPRPVDELDGHVRPAPAGRDAAVPARVREPERR